MHNRVDVLMPHNVMLYIFAQSITNIRRSSLMRTLLADEPHSGAALLKRTPPTIKTLALYTD